MKENRVQIQTTFHATHLTEYLSSYLRFDCIRGWNILKVMHTYLISFHLSISIVR